MSLKKKLFRGLAAAGLAAGILFAQTQSGAASGSTATQHGQRMLQFLTNYLNLTASQQQQAQSIFQDAMTQAQPLVQQLKQDRQNMQTAIQSGQSDSAIDAIALAQGSALGNLAGIRAKAFAHLYTILTPDQKTKADQLPGMLKGMFGRRPGRSS